jgi:aspartate-semialdehyde dehydrogenase
MLQQQKASILDIAKHCHAANIRVFGSVVRIPVQSCHPLQTNAATHSISKLPLIPVNVATLWW